MPPSVVIFLLPTPKPYTEHMTRKGLGCLYGANTRVMRLTWGFTCWSGRSPVLVDEAGEDLPASNRCVGWDEECLRMAAAGLTGGEGPAQLGGRRVTG